MHCSSLNWPGQVSQYLIHNLTGHHSGCANLSSSSNHNHAFTVRKCFPIFWHFPPFHSWAKVIPTFSNFSSLISPTSIILNPCSFPCSKSKLTIFHYWILVYWSFLISKHIYLFIFLVLITSYQNTLIVSWKFTCIFPQNRFIH